MNLREVCKCLNPMKLYVIFRKLLENGILVANQHGIQTTESQIEGEQSNVEHELSRMETTQSGIESTERGIESEQYGIEQ